MDLNLAVKRPSLCLRVSDRFGVEALLPSRIDLTVRILVLFYLVFRTKLPSGGCFGVVEEFFDQMTVRDGT